MIDELKYLHAEQAARWLLGKKVLRTLSDGTVLSGLIVETEAYHQDDQAAHSYRGETPSNAALFLEGGHAYVYFTYGMHHCLNIVCGPKGYGEGVLIRGLKPIRGLESMKTLRNTDIELNLTNGPGKVAQALHIDRKLSAHNLKRGPLQLMPGKIISESNIVRTTRVGISKNKAAKLRFYIKNSPYVSRK